MARVVGARASKVDRTGAFEGFSRLVEVGLSAPSPSFWRQGPVQTQFCDNQLVRMVLPKYWKKTALCESFVRPMLYFAQHEICSFYAEQRGL